MSKRIWNITNTNFAKYSRNPLRVLYENQKQSEGNSQKSKIVLQAGDPTIYGNFKPHHKIVDKLINSVSSDKFSYIESVGLKSARQAVADYSAHMGQLSPDDIILTSGCSMAVEIACRSLANVGDNILVPTPGWNYTTWLLSSGIYPRYYKLDPKKDWQVDLEHLESLIDSKTCAIIVNSPGNPCGNVLSKEHITDIINIAEDHCLPIISDEVYEFSTYPGISHHSFASLSTKVPVLVCSGLTKRFLIPGIRLGWLIINDRQDILKDLRGGLRNIAARNFGPNSSVQHALPEILKTPQDYFEETSRKISKNAKIVYDHLISVPALNPSMPKGAMYMVVKVEFEQLSEMANSTEFMDLLSAEQNVLVYPSEAFFSRNFFRITLTVPEQQLVEACDRISEFCRKYLKQ